MTLKGDYIVEATLLRPTGDEPRPFPTPEEEAALPGKENDPSEAPGPSLRHSGIPRLVETAEQTTTPVMPALSCLASKPCSYPSQKGKMLGKGTDVNHNKSSQWVQAYMDRDDRTPDLWKEFCPLDSSVDGSCDDAKVKTLACLQAVAFHVPATQKKVHGYRTTPPCLTVLGKREYLPPRYPRITRRYRGRRWWHWLLCSRGVPSIPEPPQTHSAEWCRSSMNA